MERSTGAKLDRVLFHATPRILASEDILRLISFGCCISDSEGLEPSVISYSFTADSF